MAVKSPALDQLEVEVSRAVEDPPSRAQPKSAPRVTCPCTYDDQVVDIDQQQLAQPRQVLMSRCGRGGRRGGASLLTETMRSNARIAQPASYFKEMLSLVRKTI